LLEKTIAYIRLKNSNGTPQTDYTAHWYKYGSPPYAQVAGTPNANGVLLNAMDGYNNTHYAYHKVRYLNSESYTPLAQIPASNSFYAFQLTKVTVQLKKYDGTFVSGTGPDVHFYTYFSGTPGEILFGQLVDGSCSRDLLAGYRHYFTIKNYNGTLQQIWQDNLIPPVVFQTFRVVDSDWGCTNYYQYGWPAYGQTFPGSEVELLPKLRTYYKNSGGATKWFDVMDGGQTLNLSTGELGKSAQQPETGEQLIPTNFELSQNYPNPFNPSTTISVALPVDATVNLAVYNSLGQMVAELMNGTVSAGYHDVVFDATNLASGLYIYKMIAKGNDGRDFTNVQKMMLMK